MLVWVGTDQPMKIGQYIRVQDKKLAEHLSEKGRIRRMKENDITAVMSRQIEIYKEVLEYEHNKYCI